MSGAATRRGGARAPGRDAAISHDAGVDGPSPRPAVSRRGEPGAAKFLPDSPKASLTQLREASAVCHGCDLYKHATQTVFGEGAAKATVMMVGEQPGDQEDKQGHPFVGPAGALLDKALEDAGIDRKHVYITNAVKHFKWTPAPRGKRRLHSKPNAAEMWACRPWLEREIAAVKPRVLVVLGASAAQSLLGAAFRVSKDHGKVMEGASLILSHGGWEELGTHVPKVVATIHPSAVLRAPEKADRDAAYAQLVADLKVAARAAGE